jgi:Excalibur calcium-binding domain
MTTTPLRPWAALIAAGLLLAGTAGVSGAVAATDPAVSPTALSVNAVPEQATAKKPTPKTYKNCTALHKVYKHGVGKKGAKDTVKGSSKPVTNFTVDTKTYNLNKKSDRDKDGVACEKK